MLTKYWFPSAVIGDFLKQDVEITVNDGLIEEIEFNTDPASDAIQINGVALPGFIDTHCHGGNGYFFSDTEFENVLSIAEFHLQRGTTSLLASLVTQSESMLKEQVSRLSAFVPFSTVRGIHLEGPWLSLKYCGAHDSSQLRSPDVNEIQNLIHESNNKIISVTLAPEIDGAMAAIDFLKANGIVIALGHTDADSQVTREAIERGSKVVTHYYSAMRPISHRISSLALEALYDEDIFLEIILDGTHIIPEAVKLLLDIAKHKLIAVSDAISAAGSQDGEIKLGSIVVEVKNGVAKIKGSDLLAGSTLTMKVAFKFLMENFKIEYVEAAKIFASNAALKYNFTDVGVIGAGKRADIVVVNSQHDIISVIHQGGRVL